MYVGFPVADGEEGSPLAQRLSSLNTRALIWTTTPWTLPANVAVCVNPNLQYGILEFRGKPGITYLAALDLLPQVQRIPGFDGPVKLHDTLLGSSLQGVMVSHPTQTRRVPIICGQHVTNDSGTGCASLGSYVV